MITGRKHHRVIPIFYLLDYQPVHQSTPDYIDCKNQGAPEGKACRMTLHDFGIYCTHLNDYGYHEGRPCILLMLKLVGYVQGIMIFSNSDRLPLWFHSSMPSVSAGCRGFQSLTESHSML